MGQEDMTLRDLCTQIGRNRRSGHMPEDRRIPARIARICLFVPQHLRHLGTLGTLGTYFLVAVIAEGDENLIVLPSTMPVHF